MEQRNFTSETILFKTFCTECCSQTAPICHKMLDDRLWFQFINWTNSFTSMCKLVVTEEEDWWQQARTVSSALLHVPHIVTVETRLAHTLESFLAKSSPHRPCVSPFMFICVFRPRHWFVLFELNACLYMQGCSPSGSQSFFSARHMGALIRRFLPLERTVVALKEQTTL